MTRCRSTFVMPIQSPRARISPALRAARFGATLMSGANFLFTRSRGQAPDAVGVKLTVGAEHGDALNQCPRHDHPINQ